MATALRALLLTLPTLFRSSSALRTEVLALRHQVLVLQRQVARRRITLQAGDRLLWVWLSQLWTGWRDSLLIVQPVIRWHRRGFGGTRAERVDLGAPDYPRSQKMSGI